MQGHNLAMKRRDFIAGTAIGATALALSGCHRAEEKTEGTSANINRGMNSVAERLRSKSTLKTSLSLLFKFLTLLPQHK